MRRLPVAALGAVAALLAIAATADAALEPVTITADAPGTVTAGSPFKLEVTVEAEAGAFDVAAQPLLLGVKLAPECGGSLAGTAGSPSLERALPAVPAGSAFKQTFAAEVTTAATGTEVLCAYLQDAQERQFATDTEAEVTVLSAAAAASRGQQCTAATKALTGSKRSLRRLKRRIAKVRRQLHRAQGPERQVLARKLHKLRAKRHKLAKRRRQSTKAAAGSCS